MKIAFLTSGGNAPCLNASIGRIIFNLVNSIDSPQFIGYKNGFSGLLKGEFISIEPKLSENELELYSSMGGSVIGNSRTKLTNIDDCIDKKLVNLEQVPLEVAAEQLIRDKVDVLFAIGGDDTNSTAKDLYNYIISRKISITVIGIPKTIDNDIFPIKRSLGAYSAAQKTADFFNNIVNENFMSSKHLIVHEIMGRNCGWLAAHSAKFYIDMLDKKESKFVDPFDINRFHIHALYIPEVTVNFEIEIRRLKNLINRIGCLNIFVCEGSFSNDITAQLGENLEKDAYGHIKLDTMDTGRWLSDYLKKEIEIDRTLVQKSGYFARSSQPTPEDLSYIYKICDFSCLMVKNKKSGVAGEDERTGNIQAVDFNDIKGDKPFDVSQEWFQQLMSRIESSN